MTDYEDQISAAADEFRQLLDALDAVGSPSDSKTRRNSDRLREVQIGLYEYSDILKRVKNVPTNAEMLMHVGAGIEAILDKRPRMLPDEQTLQIACAAATIETMASLVAQEMFIEYGLLESFDAKLVMAPQATRYLPLASSLPFLHDQILFLHDQIVLILVHCWPITHVIESVSDVIMAASRTIQGLPSLDIHDEGFLRDVERDIRVRVRPKWGKRVTARSKEKPYQQENGTSSNMPTDNREDTHSKMRGWRLLRPIIGPLVSRLVDHLIKDD